MYELIRGTEKVRDCLSDVECFLAGYLEGRGDSPTFIQESHIRAVTDAVSTYRDIIRRAKDEETTNS